MINPNLEKVVGELLARQRTATRWTAQQPARDAAQKKAMGELYETSPMFKSVSKLVAAITGEELKETQDARRKRDRALEEEGLAVVDEAGEGAGGRELPLECPLSLAPFVKPLRTPCGHYFESANLKNLFTKAVAARGGTRASTRCPQGGCTKSFTYGQCKAAPEILDNMIQQQKLARISQSQKPQSAKRARHE